MAVSKEKPAILEQAALLSDATRCRLLSLLEQQELTVSELCTVLQLPQSTVSRHLKALRDQRWIDLRREATRRYYASNVESVPPLQRRLWILIRESLSAAQGDAQDRRRLQEVLAQRRQRSKAFFDASAEQWDALREELFGGAFDVSALLAFLDEAWVVGDLGCGTGRLTSLLAPFVRRVVAVDSSQAMLAAAAKRLESALNVELRCGSVESLPIADGELDAAAVVLTLHHVADPRKVVREVARVLKKEGRLILLDMQPHDRESYRSEMGHVWLGFGEDFVRSAFEAAGFGAFEYRAVTPDLAAGGPGLFVARGRLTRQVQRLAPSEPEQQYSKGRQH